MASSSRLKPGEKGEIRVSVDVRGKQGYISKTINVYTNDPKEPVSTLTVKMYLKDRVHMDTYKATELFGEKCRECHVDKGRGMRGWDLFKADCFMCHNAGKNASLTEMSRKPEEYLIRIIRKGVDNTVMPGWEKRSGGPLDEDDIRSLIDLIKQ
jgi:hypothetical protein